jgi:hypothetical protein
VPSRVVLQGCPPVLSSKGVLAYTPFSSSFRAIKPHSVVHCVIFESLPASYFFKFPSFCTFSFSFHCTFPYPFSILFLYYSPFSPHLNLVFNRLFPHPFNTLFPYLHPPFFWLSSALHVSLVPGSQWWASLHDVITALQIGRYQFCLKR